MRAVKPLDADGYTKNEYVAYVSQSYTIISGSLTNTEYVTIDFADQPSDDWKFQQTSDFDLGTLNSSSGIYSYPLFSLLNRAFYSSQSIVEYGTSSAAVTQFTPSESLYVFNIANAAVGEGVGPGSFSVRVSGSSPIVDDGYGRLYVGNTRPVVTALFVGLQAEFEIQVDDTTGISPGMIVTGTGFTSETVTVVAVHSSTLLELSIIVPDPIPDVGTVLTFTNTEFYIGNIFYKHGIAVVKNNVEAPTQSISTNGLKLLPFLAVNVAFSSSFTIAEHTIVCKLRPTEFNASIFNHTVGYYKAVTGSYVSGSDTVTFTNYIPNVSSSLKVMSSADLEGINTEFKVVAGVSQSYKTGPMVSSPNSNTGPLITELFDVGLQYGSDSVSGSLTPYVTTIGLYNRNYELLAIAKLANPIPRAKNVDQTFIVKFDT